MGRNYILDDHNPIVETDSYRWAQWFEDATKDGRRIVRQTTFLDGKEVPKTQREDEKAIFISTVFLGLDHQYGDGPPLLFETMVFGGENDGYQTRCSTWDEAEAQHLDALRLVKGGE